MFADWFAQVVKERLGKPMPTCSVSEVLLGLKLQSVVNRETARKLVRERQDPSPGVQAKIRHALQPEEPEPPKPSGWKTRELVLSFFSSSDPKVYAPERQPQMSPDIEVYYRFGNVRHLVRCLEDEDQIDPGKPHPGEEYFRPFIRQAKAEVPDAYQSVTLLTHHPIPPALKLAERDRQAVELLTVSEFVGQNFDINYYKDYLTKKTLEAGFSGEAAACPLGYHLHGEEHPVGDCLDYVLALAVEPGRQVICAILGSAGTGKTSLCLRAALRLIDRVEKAPSRPTLPVVVEARDLARPGDLLRAVLDAVENNYRHGLREDLLKRLIEEGRLVVFLDGLDESRAFRGWTEVSDLLSDVSQRLGGGTKLFLTMRPELFQSREEEDAALRSRHVQRVRLKPLEVNDACKALTARVGNGEAADLLREGEDPELARQVLILIRTPLFLHLLARFGPASRNKLRELPPGADYDSRYTYTLYQACAKEWVKREEAKGRAFQLTLTEDERLDWCREIAGDCFSRPLDQPRITLPLLKRLYESARSKHPARGTLLTVTKPHDFLLDARLSMFLVRDPKVEEDACQFSHTSFYEFFLGTAIAEGILRGAPDLLGRGQLARPMTLVPRFVLGRLAEESRPASGRPSGSGSGFSASGPRRGIGGGYPRRPTAPGSEFLAPELLGILEALRSDSGIRSRAKASDFMVYNVLFLIAGISRVSAQNLEVSLHGLALPLQELSCLAPPSTETLSPDPSPGALLNLHLGNANTEFVRKPNDRVRLLPKEGTQMALGPRLGEKESIPPRPRRPSAALKRYCQEQLEETDAEEKIRGGYKADLYWVLVPGGVWKVGRYGREEEDQVITKFGSRRIGWEEIILPSFLIQRWPVTNQQYWEFLSAAPEHRCWYPDAQRVATGNIYYLIGWDQMLGRKIENMTAEDWRRVEEDAVLNEWWHHAPVVNVNWKAADAFARYYGWSLPTEAEFEAAARLYQTDKLLDRDPSGRQSGVDLADYPWGDALPPDVGLKDAVKLYAISSETFGKTPPGLPTWDATNLNPGKKEEDGGWLAKFAEWAKDKEVAYHLIGGVREWMADFWDPFWPLGLHRLAGGKLVVPCNVGLRWEGSAEKGQVVVENEREQLQQRVLRGGSMATLPENCRISYRDPQPMDNVNPDAGFRCVKRLWPDPGPESCRRAKAARGEEAGAGEPVRDPGGRRKGRRPPLRETAHEGGNT
jgi:formylglycine-generating enzyme required for sulfatase activity